jgi:hypothetical protein
VNVLVKKLLAIELNAVRNAYIADAAVRPFSVS